MTAPRHPDGPAAARPASWTRSDAAPAPHPADPAPPPPPTGASGGEPREAAARPSVPAQPAAIQPGDRFIAFDTGTGHRWILHADGRGTRKEKGLGIVDPDRMAGTEYGSLVALGSKRVRLLRPGLADLVATLQRKAQIITPKDGSRILFELGIGPGDRVFESGIGSGAATIPLCWAVGDTGEVVAQELRGEFSDWARGNLERAGLAQRLTVVLGDLTEGLAPGVVGPFQACLLDQPEPWRAIGHVLPVLDAGARVACYCPQISQMEQTWRALEALGFVQLRCMELIERTWEVKERGSRPAFEGLGHTGFLVFARWPGPPA